MALIPAAVGLVQLASPPPQAQRQGIRMTTREPIDDHRADTAGPVRVPDPTLVFWVTKAASTALGEAASDFSIRVMPPVLAVLLGFVLFLGALAWQLRQRRYRPEVYWFAVAMVGVFGTMAADVAHV